MGITLAHCPSPCRNVVSPRCNITEVFVAIHAIGSCVGDGITTDPTIFPLDDLQPTPVMTLEMAWTPLGFIMYYLVTYLAQPPFTFDDAATTFQLIDRSVGEVSVISHYATRNES